MSQKILITGGSSGFGQLTVRALIDGGHRVAASVRDPGGRNAEPASTLRELGAAIVEIDVTDDRRPSNAAPPRAHWRHLDGRLDVLINNAGVGVIGLAEGFTVEDFRRVFEINVFGVQRMNRAVLPGFRAQGRGLLLHVSSLLGRMTIPFYGPYNASKWALEALAETYRTELSQLGIESCLVEPGGYPTPFMDRLIRPSDRTRDDDYGPLANAPQASLEGFHAMLMNTPAQDPQNVANAIAAVVDAPRGQRPLRTVVDSIGMGDAIRPYNEMLHSLTEAIYTNMGTEGMLRVNVASSD